MTGRYPCASIILAKSEFGGTTIGSFEFGNGRGLNSSRILDCSMFVGGTIAFSIGSSFGFPESHIKAAANTAPVDGATNAGLFTMLRL